MYQLLTLALTLLSCCEKRNTSQIQGKYISTNIQQFPHAVRKLALMNPADATEQALDFFSQTQQDKLLTCSTMVFSTI